MVSEPVKPSSRSVSAALNPASDAPTITMRPSLRSPGTGAHPITEEDGLDRARRRGLAHALDLVFRDGRGVQQPLLAVQLEHLRCEEHALRIALAAREIHNGLHPHHLLRGLTPSSSMGGDPEARTATARRRVAAAASALPGQFERDVRGQGAQEVGRVEDLTGGGDTDRTGPAAEDAVDRLHRERRADGVDVPAACHGAPFGATGAYDDVDDEGL